MQDGYVSQTWQAWCSFCRELVLSSAVGEPTATNGPTGSPHAGRTTPELAWIGMRAARGDKTLPIQAIKGDWLEPTWGDVTKFQDITSAFQINNEATVLSGVLSAGQTARHLQIIRNASAHTTVGNISKVKALAQFYQAGVIILPADTIFWAEPVTGEFLYKYWTARLIGAAKFAVQ